MQDKAIINIATGRYIKGQQRLKESLKPHTDADLLFYQNEGAVGSTPHKTNPYGFKTYAFLRALSKGYKYVIWLDASVYCEKSVEPVFGIIKDRGYVMQYAGHMAGSWANDRCLEYFDIGRDEAMGISMYGNAGFLGLSGKNAVAMRFLSNWHKSNKAGIFKGGWTNNNNSESRDPRCKGHRHDMVCGSIIAHNLGMKIEPAGKWLEYKPPLEPAKNKSVVFGAQGI